ncbi:NAD-dependent epimerase/dehydratase family protein [Picrophilus oshimae]|uniref:Nucleoside-diphosphate-sugar epimerase n=1 Tax=Picrophilus torridus (strain ATCC 700027 / DSM 9790 / JCM 10055 / NBRC 100828 / KAW 2/3) TaxID=1122961 RepID=Q6KZJ0_PICTO|nr:sugar nucleotide-binding protein [Picrophilus oshimae]AAT43862.1 nucleoside-diphosphate-sugar epimerase [Picrophilus oshimae DSM 9789]
MERILVLNGLESCGFRFVKSFQGKYDIKFLEPLELKRFLHDLTMLDDIYDVVINNMEIGFFNTRNYDYMNDINVRLNEYISTRFKKAKIILMSSQFVYKSSEALKDEDYTTQPETEYGKTKLEAEKIIKKHDSYIIIRRGFSYGKCTMNLYMDIINALRSHTPIKLNSNVYINPVLNSDLADITEMLIDDDNDIYNVAGDEYMTLYDMGNIICNYLKESCNFIKISYIKNLNYAISSERIKKKYNYKFFNISDDDILIMQR